MREPVPSELQEVIRLAVVQPVFLESTKGHRIAIAIDPCYISKSGKKTPGIDWFWSGCAAAMKKGLEIFGISRIQDVQGCHLGCKPRTRGPCRRSRLS